MAVEEVERSSGRCLAEFSCLEYISLRLTRGQDIRQTRQRADSDRWEEGEMLNRRSLLVDGVGSGSVSSEGRKGESWKVRE
jgi:hypothetical protein